MNKSRTFRLGGSVLLAVISTVALLVSIWPLQRDSFRIPLENPIKRHGTLVMEVPGEVRFRDTVDVMTIFNFEQVQTPENFLLEIRLDVPGLSVSPQPIYIGPIEPGKSQKFEWEILAQQKGKFSGTLWMYLTPPDQPEKKQVFLSKQFNLKVLDYGGMPGFLIRWVGAAGFLAALMLWFIPNRKLKIDKNIKKMNN